jgi:NAD(P)-dependent dehydrogenase (short-subunit alcohol dehydrogenase family)
MARIFITGSTEGLGRAAAEALMRDGHEVVLHARSHARLAAVEDLAARAAGVAIGDFGSAAQTRDVAAQADAIGRLDAVIHNAGIYTAPDRGTTVDGHAATLAINTLAPFILTATMRRPARLVYLSSSLHRQGEGPLDDIDWTARPWDGARAYAESKLHLVALAKFVARLWPEVRSNAVDPGWVRTRMGGASAPVDLDTGQRTQSWLATSDDEGARVSGGYFHDQRQQRPAPQTDEPAFQDALVARLSELTGVSLPDR